MRLSMSHEDGLEKTLLTSGPGEWGAEGYLGGWELAVTTFEYRLSASRCEQLFHVLTARCNSLSAGRRVRETERHTYNAKCIVRAHF